MSTKLSSQAGDGRIADHDKVGEVEDGFLAGV